MNIVRLEIVDNDTMNYEERLQGVFYLVDPNEEKLEELKTLIENRFETGAIEQYYEVVAFIVDNFNMIRMDTFQIEW